jgi:hypothetical protein
MSNNKLWESHRMISPEAREMAINQCGDCRFFVTIQGVTEKRLGCIVEVRKYRTLSVRVPAMIHVMELMKSEGKEGLTRILEKGNPLSQACEMWLPR